MIPIIYGAVLAVSSSLAALIVIKVTVVAALGLAAAWLARRSRAAVRHALLAVMFGATLVLPIASIVAPPVRVTVPVAGMSRAWPPVVNTTAPIQPVTAAASRAAPTAPQQSSTFSVSILLFAGWIVGTAVFLVPVIIGLWQIRSLRRSGLPWLDGQSIAQTLALDAGIHRRVEVLLHEALSGPITCGVLGPAIVLPRDAERWVQEDLSRAMVHELEHVRRGDSATRCLARAVCALYWFHPLAWIAWRKLVLEAERSCDDAVLRRSEATAYADQLVGLAKRLPTAQSSPLLAMASRSDLATRVGAVLNSQQRRGQTGKLSLTLAFISAVVLVLGLSPLRLVAAPQDVQPAQTKPTFEVAAIRPHQGPSSYVGFRPSGSQFDVIAVNVVGMVMFAYDLKRYQVTGGPGWTESVPWDITAKAPSQGTPPGPGQFKKMMQELLADRFKVVFHRESKASPVYALVIAGKNKPKLTESASDAEFTMGIGGNQLRATKTSMDRLAMQLCNFRGMDVPVVDKTGLTGEYDFKLAWSDSDSTEGDWDALLEDQLGLKLVRDRAPIQVLVLDKAERPSEN